MIQFYERKKTIHLKKVNKVMWCNSVIDGMFLWISYFSLQ